MYKIPSVILTILLLLVSCNSKNSPEKFAQDACACITQSGFDDLVSGKNTLPEDYFTASNSPECVKKMSNRLSKILKNKSHQQRVDFTRELFKAALDTKCGDIILNFFIPYEELIKEFEKSTVE